MSDSGWIGKLIVNLHNSRIMFIGSHLEASEWFDTVPQAVGEFNRELVVQCYVTNEHGTHIRDLDKHYRMRRATSHG